MALIETFDRILSTFPRKHLQMAFAYGSGVFQQKGHVDMRKNMIDFIFVVDNPVEWHTSNLMQNKKHYSFIKYMGPKRIAKLQEQYGASVYFNTLVPVHDRLIKYGVISTSALKLDLLDWETLYIGGRLHKPVNMVLPTESADLNTALRVNLQNAIHAALLLLTESFSEEELFLTIAKLSYAGDFRMTVGEDKNKVSNIVGPNMDAFRELYGKHLEKEPHLSWNQSQGEFEQSLCTASRFHHLNLLPKKVQTNLVKSMNKGDGYFRDIEEVIHALAHDPDCSQMVEKSISDIVKASALFQSAKTILTAGFSKSIRYSSKKLQKMWRGKK